MARGALRRTCSFAGLAAQQARRLVGGGVQGVEVEHLADVARHLPQALPQVVPRRRVQRQQAPIGVPGEQVVRLAVDVARRTVRAQHPMALGAVHEEGVLDLPRALRHHLPDQMLATAVVRRLHGGNVEHTEQLALRIEDRRRGTGQVDEGGAEVIALVHRHRSPVGEYGGHPAGALLAFRPAGAEVQPGLAAVVADGRLDTVVDGPPLGIGEQYAVVGIAHPSMQSRHLFAGDAQEQFGTLATFVEEGLRENPRPLQGPRVETVLLHGAAPGVEDRRRHRRLRQARGVPQDTADTVHMVLRVCGKHGASVARHLVVVPPIKRPSATLDKRRAATADD